MIQWFDASNCSHCGTTAIGHVVLVCSHADTKLNHVLASFDVCLDQECAFALKAEILDRFAIGFVDIQDFVWFDESETGSRFRHLAWNNPGM